jgi:hypothetical protein
MAMVLPLVWLASPPAEIGLRGAASAPEVHLDLFVVQEGSERAERWDARRAYSRGDRIYFSVSTTQEELQDVTVWVSGPEGTSQVGVGAAGLTPVRVGTDAAAVFYRVEDTGRYRFMASVEGMGQCPDPGCASRTVEVLP